MAFKLFRDTNLIGLVQPSPAEFRGVERERYVLIDVNPFFNSPESVEQVELNYFSDVHLMAKKVRVKRLDDSIIWKGRIVGAPKSQVFITLYPKQKLFHCNTTIKYGNPGFEPASYQANNDSKTPGELGRAQKDMNKVVFPNGPLSGLDKEAETFVGKTLWCAPFYGWGWASGYNEKERRDTDVPSPFRFVLKRILTIDEERSGGVGQIQEPGHPADGYWVIFSLRHAGTGNFTNNVVSYNIDIEEKEPVDDEEGWPISPPSENKKALSLHGFCQIGVQKPVTLPPAKFRFRALLKLIPIGVVVFVGVLIVLFIRHLQSH